MSFAPWILLAALLPLGAFAAEKLEGEALDNAYVPMLSGQIHCSKADEDSDHQTCSTQPSDSTRAVTDKALRDSENRVLSESVANPNLNNPNALPPPTQLQEAPMNLPTPQDLINLWNSRPPL